MIPCRSRTSSRGPGAPGVTGLRAVQPDPSAPRGYDIDELRSDAAKHLLEVTDVLVTGRYVREQRTLASPWLGSANQRIHFLSDRYDPSDMTAALEVRIARDGTFTLTGFPDNEWFADG